ncbi:hypothetical protein [Haloferula helveola]
MSFPTMAVLLGLASPVTAQVVLLQEEFDNTRGYNPDSATALVGDGDWVDFGNRLTDSFAASEGYATADGGTESVLTGEPTSADPQVRSDFALGIPKNQVGEVTLRIRADVNNDDVFDASDVMIPGDVSLFYTVAQFGEPGATNGPGPNSFGTPTITAQTDGWYLFSWADPGGLTAGGTAPNVEGIRLDPLNGLIGTSFEIDSFIIYQTANPPPVIELDPGSAVGGEFTLRQEWDWDVDGDPDGWTANGQFDVVIPGGIASSVVTGTSTGGDANWLSPVFNVPDVESGRFVMELGIVSEPGDTTPKQLFYALSGGAFGATQRIDLAAPADDGALHVYRITFDDDINAPITRLRLDPSNTTGIVSNIDFVRIYSEGPEILPPTAELDPAALGPEYVLAQEWTFETDDDLEGWTPNNQTVEVPNDGFTGVYSGALWGEASTGDPQLSSPTLSITEPPSGRVVIEIDIEPDPGTSTAPQLFWALDGGGFSGANALFAPTLPSDGSPHTLRFNFENDLPGTLTNLRFDPSGEISTLVGIGAIRIYRDLTGASDYDQWSSEQAWTPGDPNTGASEDFDADGIDNDTERLFGLVPTDPSSVNPIASPLTTAGTFSYNRRNPTLAGATYTVFTSTDLSVWTEDSGAIQSATGGDLQTVNVQLTATAVDGRLFVRVEAQ